MLFHPPETPRDAVDPGDRQASNDVPFIDVAGLSDIGKVRRHNEDSFLTADLKRELVLGPSSLPLRQGTCLVDECRGKIIAVADGVAGTGAGTLASSVVVNTLARYIGTAMPWIVEAGEEDEKRLAEEFENAFKRCQMRLRSEIIRHGYKNQAIATTLTMGFVAWPQLYIAHAGDSRCYLYRAERLRCLTVDDTMAQRMIDHEIVSAERASKVPFGNILINAIGGDGEDPSIEFHRVPLLRGDRILLCTDGITHHLTNLDIKETLHAGVTSEMCCRRLIDLANARGGHDNMTAVVAGIN